MLRPEFNLRAVYTGFVVDKVALGQVFPDYFGYRLSVILTKLHVHSSIIPGLYRRPIKGCRYEKLIPTL